MVSESNVAFKKARPLAIGGKKSGYAGFFRLTKRLYQSLNCVTKAIPVDATNSFYSTSPFERVFFPLLSFSGLFFFLKNQRFDTSVC